ncbi:MAG: putative CRISPR-associated protein [Ignavibacteria bacterium]|nr:MAG: putative CRISPR-associated protein [Ignavibacteria bacterium]KAF0158116.1 MAG: putative CRISPR-associated protein [Ignavibacteria bacterium]
MLINLSNHPTDLWNEKQLLSAVSKYGIIVELPFPAISPKATKRLVEIKANVYAKVCIELIKLSQSKNNAVHIMGELTFTYLVVFLLKKNNITCIASTTERNAIEYSGKKISRFNFVKFREY